MEFRPAEKLMEDVVPGRSGAVLQAKRLGGLWSIVVSDVFNDARPEHSLCSRVELECQCSGSELDRQCCQGEVPNEQNETWSGLFDEERSPRRRGRGWRMEEDDSRSKGTTRRFKKTGRTDEWAVQF